jgi:hypothetical protein
MTDAERERIRKEALEEASLQERMRSMERELEQMIEDFGIVRNAASKVTMENNDLKGKVDVLMADKAKVDKYKAWLVAFIVMGALGVLFRPAVNLWNLLNEFATKGGQ